MVQKFGNQFYTTFYFCLFVIKSNLKKNDKNFHQKVFALKRNSCSAEELASKNNNKKSLLSII
jgi:hypothetical protein